MEPRPGPLAATASDTVVFHVDELVCGMDIIQIQEIKKIRSHTPVHRAPPHVRGLVNMRGQIVTLIDVRARLGLPPRALGNLATAIIVSVGNELVGLLVDEVDDVIQPEPGSIQPPPANLRGVEGQYVRSVIRTKDGLIAVIDRDRIASAETPTDRREGR